MDAGARAAKKAGQTAQRLWSVAAWRESPYFSDAERAALALTEAATRLSDRADAVPDEIWNQAAQHYDEEGLAAVILMIAITNFFNRINATIREPAGTTWGWAARDTPGWRPEVSRHLPGRADGRDAAAIRLADGRGFAP